MAGGSRCAPQISTRTHVTQPLPPPQMQRHARSLLRLACIGLCACSALLAAAVAAGAAVAPTRLVQSLTFAAVKSEPQQRLTLFYFDGDAEAQGLRDMVEEVAQSLSSALPTV